MKTNMNVVLRPLPLRYVSRQLLQQTIKTTIKLERNCRVLMLSVSGSTAADHNTPITVVIYIISARPLTIPPL